MENKITPEVIEKAKAADSPEELMLLAKENRIIFTAEQAVKCFDEMHKSGELSDDELENVAGGGCKGPKIENWGCEDFVCASCGSCGFGKHCGGRNPECKYCKYANGSNRSCSCPA